MTTETRAACAGIPHLWESTDPRDHAEARKVCLDVCEARDWCRAQLADTLASVHGGGVRGTWAGQFFGKRGKTRDLPGDAQEVAVARSAYTHGDRSEWAKAGNAAYERERWANKRAEEAS